MAMPFRKVWAVFQPFTFSRTAMLLDEFAEALSIPDHAVLTDIMAPAKRTPITSSHGSWVKKFPTQSGSRRTKAIRKPPTNGNTRTSNRSPTISATMHRLAIWSSHWLRRCQQGEQDDSGGTGTAAEYEVTAIPFCLKNFQNTLFSICEKCCIIEKVAKQYRTKERLATLCGIALRNNVFRKQYTRSP